MEIGGYLSLESRNGEEYYYGKNVYRFNSARSALKEFLSNTSFKRIYLPVYLCESVKNSLYDIDIEIRFYHINERLLPEIKFIQKDEVILITNYFGIHRNKIEFVNMYKNVIFDNTQAFFEKPIEEAFNIYSCRKFFGVTDGAYLIGNVEMDGCIEEYVPQYANYLLDAITFSTNYAYSNSLNNEKQIEKDGIKNMSKLSLQILKNINYNDIIKKRLDNYKILKEGLIGLNELDDSLEDSSVPMVYPFLVKSELLRSHLINKKVYIPQWWRYILDSKIGNEYENKLTQYLLPLPIDQRYGTNEMNNIIDIIKKVIL